MVEHAKCGRTIIAGTGQRDTWHLFYDAVDVTPLGVIWDSAKIAISHPGILDKYHGKLNTKTEQKGN